VSANFARCSKQTCRARVVTLHTPATELDESMSEKILRVGVLGCGPISQFAHFESVQKSRNAALHAVCDADEGLANHFGRFYDAKNIYSDYDRMLAERYVGQGGGA